MLDPLEPFGLRTARRRLELSLPGSPERCVSRTVVEDTQGRLWMLEQLAAGQRERREAIARILHALSCGRTPDVGDAPPPVSTQERATLAGMIPAFRITRENGFCASLAGMSWQLSPFVHSDELPRPAYLDEADRATGLVAFMSALRRAGGALPVDLVRALGPRMDMAAYAAELNAAILDREPGVAARLEPLLEALHAVLEEAGTARFALCHGDLHPLNVLWRGTGAVAVIDWEFLGLKPEGYDLANLLGCLGFEHPDGLTGALALGLTAGLREAGTFAPQTWAMLPELIAAQRLGWLSEWLRKDERDLLDMELEYMALLLERADALRTAWSGGGA